VPEGFTVPPNVPFSPAPFTGTVMLPDTFVQGLRDQGVTELGGTGQIQIVQDAAGGYGEDVIGLAFAPTAMPPSGPMTLDLTGVSGLTTSLNEMEPWSTVALGFSLTGEPGPSTLSCRPPNGLGVIDTMNTMVAPMTTPVLAGATVSVSYDSGDTVEFEVTRSAAVPKSRTPKDDSIWDAANPRPLIRLITCDPTTPLEGGHYVGNWVLWGRGSG